MPEYHFSNLVMDFSRLLEILKENNFFNKKRKNDEHVGCHLSIKTSSLRELEREIIFQYLYKKFYLVHQIGKF